MVGQFLTACAQPFMLYAPTKLAAFWFGPNERAICTNFASIGMSVSTVCVSLPSYMWVTRSYSLTRTHSLVLTHSYSLTHSLTPSANPIGIAVAQLASPYIVTSTDKLPMMVLFITIVCIHLSLLPHFMKIFKYTHLPTFLFPPLRTHSAVDLHGASRCGSVGDRRGLLVEQATPPPYPHLRG